MMEKTNIPIFFTIDDTYAPYVSCAISSMIENSSKQYHYKIYILHQNLSQDNISKILSLESSWKIILINSSNYPEYVDS